MYMYGNEDCAHFEGTEAWDFPLFPPLTASFRMSNQHSPGDGHVRTVLALALLVPTLCLGQLPVHVHTDYRAPNPLPESSFLPPP